MSAFVLTFEQLCEHARIEVNLAKCSGNIQNLAALIDVATKSKTEEAANDPSHRNKDRRPGALPTWRRLA